MNRMTVVFPARILGALGDNSTFPLAVPRDLRCP